MDYIYTDMYYSSLLYIYIIYTRCICHIFCPLEVTPIAASLSFSLSLGLMIYELHVTWLLCVQYFSIFCILVFQYFMVLQQQQQMQQRV